MDKKLIFLEQAWQQFNKSGFHATGIEKLRENLGITKKTLYRYFASKEQLILEVLEYRHNVFISKLQDALNGHIQQKAALAYIDFIEDWVKQDNFFGCTFINVSAEYSQQMTQPHQIANSHKQKVLQILIAHQIPDPTLTYIFLIGEGLIVANQIMNYEPDFFIKTKELIKNTPSQR